MSTESIKQALKRAFQLGQKYWSWADSEYSSHWKKADAAKEEFDKLVKDTLLTTPPAQEFVCSTGLCHYRKPLTDEQILKVARDHYSPHQRPEISFARAIEAAHGIKGDA